MSSVEVVAKSAAETKKIGLILAETIKKQPFTLEKAIIIALIGDLGAGKTIFVQGLALGFNIKKYVLSPTFVILKDFPISLENYKNFYHIDAYRLKNPNELLELGFGDLIKNSENIIIIEWADRISDILPEGILWISFKSLGKNRRKLTFNFKL